MLHLNLSVRTKNDRVTQFTTYLGHILDLSKVLEVRRVLNEELPSVGQRDVFRALLLPLELEVRVNSQDERVQKPAPELLVGL